MNKYEVDKNKKVEDFLRELDLVFSEKDYSKKIKPMTLEGCVVRLSDIIAYIGRDIEDAIIVGSIKREDIPKKIVKLFGNTNSQIVNTLIMDVIINSIDKPYLKFSDDIFEGLIELKNWNNENIYHSKEALKNRAVLEKAFYDLYEIYLKKANDKNLKNSENYTDQIFYDFINNKSEKYNKNTDLRRKIIDYISGGTDKFFLKECETNIKGFKI